MFQNLEDFITRLSAKNILNKRTIENLIKAGALDTLGGTRKQFMSIYVQIVDHVTQEKKNSMVGQMTLFDLVSEDQKEEFQIRMPDVGEYSKETLLAFEKEVLGIYVSGHRLRRMRRSGRNPFLRQRRIFSWMKRPVTQKCMMERKKLLVE